MRLIKWTDRIVLTAIFVIILAATVAGAVQSYNALYHWAIDIGLSGAPARMAPAAIDSFIVVGELGLLAAYVRQWDLSFKTYCWTIALLGAAVSVAENVASADAVLADQASAAVYPIAVFGMLFIGMQALKRLVKETRMRAGGLKIGLDPEGDVDRTEKDRSDAPVATKRKIGLVGLVRDRMAQWVEDRRTGLAIVDGQTGPVSEPVEWTGPEFPELSHSPTGPVGEPGLVAYETVRSGGPEADQTNERTEPDQETGPAPKGRQNARKRDWEADLAQAYEFRLRTKEAGGKTPSAEDIRKELGCGKGHALKLAKELDKPLRAVK